MVTLEDMKNSEEQVPEEKEVAADQDVDSSEDVNADDDSSNNSGDQDTGVKAEDLDMNLVVEAGRLGLSAGDIETLGSNAALSAVIAQAAVMRESKEEPEPEEEKFDLDLSEFEEDAAAPIKGMFDHFSKKIESLSEQNKKLNEQLAGRSQADAERVKHSRVVNEFDNVLSSSEAFADVFGSETPEVGSDMYANREKVYKAFDHMRNADGGKTSVKELATLAAAVVFPDSVRKQKSGDIVKRIEKRQAQKLNKSESSSGDTGVDTETKLLDKIDRFQRENNLGPYR